MTNRLRILFCDHLNLARGKYLFSNKPGDGVARFCRSVYGVTYDKDLIPSPGSMMLEGLPDMEARYLESEIRECWEPDTNMVVADLYGTDGEPLPMCGRGALKRAVNDWQAHGLNPQVGIELEAYAFQVDDHGHIQPYDTPGAYVYSTGRMADHLRFTDSIWECAEEMGFKLETFSSEFDSPQFEFTLVYDDALKAADDNFLFRLMAREVAHEHGVVLTFLPKPIATTGGSGIHVNFSFTNKDGNNVIANGDHGGPDHMNDLSRGCVAGLMHHHKGMAGLLAPTTNSYDRLQPASLSGYWRNWGGDHRGVTTRVSTEGGSKARLEHRMADGGANIYTTIATVLQAARLGVENKYELPPMETGDCFESQDAVEGTAENLSASLDALQQDTVLMDTVGRTLCESHIFVKRDEIEKTSELEGDGLRDFYIYYI
ncbi:MAG: glutamine synthetase [Parasphingorhabdus sp.]|jgi:glutamine synthetase